MITNIYHHGHQDTNVTWDNTGSGGKIERIPDSLYSVTTSTISIAYGIITYFLVSEEVRYHSSRNLHLRHATPSSFYLKILLSLFSELVPDVVRSPLRLVFRSCT